jgi:hypothetical protein
MAVKGNRGRRRKWKTGRLHWPGGRVEHEEDAAGRLAPLEETEAFRDSQQKDSARAPDDTIRVDSRSVQMPDSFAEDEREGASIFRVEPVALFILLVMLAFIAFVAWQISLMPVK